MATSDNLESRLSAVEREVAQLRESQALSTSDAAAARVLAAGADRDVSEVRAELRAHTSALNALRETQLEQGQRLGRVEQQVHAVGDRLGPIEQQVHAVGDRLGPIEQQVHAVGDRLGRVEQQVHAVGDRLGPIEQQVHAVGDRLGPIEQQVDAYGEQLGGFGEQVDAYGDRLESQRQEMNAGFASVGGALAQIRDRLDRDS